MTMLSERQQKAARLARELDGVQGCWVTSPLPLRDDARLRFQILDGERNRVLQMLEDAGYEAKFVSVLPRVTFAGMAAACLYEVAFPTPQQNIPQEPRSIPRRDEIATSKSSYERESILRYLGMKK
jgi:hypothetical protein